MDREINTGFVKLLQDSVKICYCTLYIPIIVWLFDLTY